MKLFQDPTWWVSFGIVLKAKYLYFPNCMNPILTSWPPLNGEKQLRPQKAFFPQYKTNSISTIWKITQLKSICWTQVIAHPGVALLLCGLFCRGADKELTGLMCVGTSIHTKVMLQVGMPLYSEILPWCWIILRVSVFKKITMFMYSLYICLSHTKFQISKMTFFTKYIFKAVIGRGVKSMQSLIET